MDWLTQQPFAHRGLHNKQQGVIENSRRAFAAAITQGYGIELDVQLSRDGQAMVFHDRGLKRLTGQPGKLQALTAKELAEINLSGSVDVIETLPAILALIGGKVPVLVEVKTTPREEAGKLEDAVATALDHYNGPAAMMSFAPSSVAWFAQNAPHIVRGVVAMDFVKEPAGLAWAERVVLAQLLHIDRTDPDFIAYNQAHLPHNSVSRLKREGMPVLSWTVRDQAAANRITPYIDQIIFEGFTPA